MCDGATEEGNLGRDTPKVSGSTGLPWSRARSANTYWKLTRCQALYVMPRPPHFTDVETEAGCPSFSKDSRPRAHAACLSKPTAQLKSGTSRPFWG